MDREPVVAEAVVRACTLLKAFRHEGEMLALRDLVGRTGLSKTTAHRLAQSLVQGGLLERVNKNSYRSLVKPLGGPGFRIGFASQTTDSEFSQEVSASVQRAAERERIPLVTVDNRYSPTRALRNADLLVRERVDLVFEFQAFEQVAPIISSKFIEADIPVVAIDIPHPGATYFGANNYQAGLIGGRALGRWAKLNWNGEVDEVLQVELPLAGPLPQLRITGMLAGLAEALPGVKRVTAARLDGKGIFEKSLEVARRYLRRTRPKRTLVLAVNDPSALGVLRAFEEAGRGHLCAVMGQNAVRSAVEELRRPGTRLVGSVAYFPERYGDELIPLARMILQKKHVPSAVFVEHLLVTPKNVGLIYPVETN
ncbi:MAG TPA: substrate-binding domain-containing protein [Pyrinomonadaceae bacterium]|nr:substrate-binding domain-containing protein [Pyrinomonadaceae bacterium]